MKCSFVSKILRDLIYSMSMVVSASVVGGIVRPSAFAVFKLIAKLNLVDTGTGSSAGFSPLRMRQCRCPPHDRLRLGSARSSSGLQQRKQTCALQKPMSALPPIATAKADSHKRSCPLYPQERTCAVQKLMSAKGQKRTYAVQQMSILFDHLVAKLQERFSN